MHKLTIFGFGSHIFKINFPALSETQVGHVKSTQCICREDKKNNPLDDRLKHMAQVKLESPQSHFLCAHQPLQI
jgi:hypothetical protein